MATRYLIVSGTIIEGRTLELLPSFVTSEPPGEAVEVRRALEEEPPEDALFVESFARDDRLVRREAIAAEPLCLDPPGTTAPQMVTGLVVFPDRTTLLRFVYHDEVLRELEVPSAPPVVRLEWRPADEVGGEETVAWHAEHPLDADLSFMILYSHIPDQWRPISLVLRDNVSAVNFDALPGGRACQIRVLASDGVNTATADSPSFRVAFRGVEPIIVHPDDGAVIPARTSLLLEGTALDWERGVDETIPARWRSSIDGELGEGLVLETLLSSGVHNIVLAAGRETELTETSISVTVQGE